MSIESFFEDDYAVGGQIMKDYDGLLKGHVKTIIDFYSKNTDIVSHFKETKRAKLMQMDHTRFEDDIFNDWDMQPKDMEFEIESLDRSDKYFLDFVQCVSTMHIEGAFNMMLLGIKEKTTQKYVGFIRFATPVITFKPRNMYFGDNGNVPGTTINKHICMGSIIVPTQPFGFNYLGGKLLSLICVSHELRQMLNNKYRNREICFFETTSLYGSLTSASQYDGLEPFIKYNGMTDGKGFYSYMPDDLFHPIREDVIEMVGRDVYNNMKWKSFQTNFRKNEFYLILRLIEENLERIDKDLLQQFKDTKPKMECKTRKKYYYSTYGYSNTKEYMLGQDSELKEGQNFHKHKLEYMIPWWKKKAQNRWEKLTTEGRLKKEVEIYTASNIEEQFTDAHILRQ